jgi:hypothetical protein
MDNFLLILSLLPLIWVNVWHSYLLAKRSKDNRPHSISEHATETPELLRTHRFMHSSSSAVMAVFALGFLLPNGYVLAACFLITAAVFDVLEVFTLNKTNASTTLVLNGHTATAWPMALFYLLYATVIIPVAQLNPLLSVAIWITPTVIAAVFKWRKFRGFWIVQHVYFCLLSLVLIIAHLRLLS